MDADDAPELPEEPLDPSSRADGPTNQPQNGGEGDGWISPDKRKWIHPSELHRTIRAFSMPPPRPALSPQEQAFRGGITFTALILLITGIFLLSGTRHLPPPPVEVEHGWLGVTVGETHVDGANTAPVVTALDPRGPAHGKLAVGDVITAVNQAAVSSTKQLARLISKMPPGQIVWLRYERGNASASQALTVASPPAQRP